MARQKRQRDTVQCAQQQVVRGLAKGGIDRYPTRVLQAVQVVNAAAADDANTCLGHVSLLTRRANAGLLPHHAVQVFGFKSLTRGRVFG